MTVLVLGGHDRLEPPLKNFAKEKGFNIKFINKPTQNLRDVIYHADVVFVIIPLVSHEMVALAKRHGCNKCVFCKSKGISRIKSKIEDLIKTNKEEVCYGG